MLIYKKGEDFMQFILLNKIFEDLIEDVNNIESQIIINSKKRK